MVRDGSITEENAQEVEQQWREHVKTWDRQRLESAISSVEEQRDSYANRNNQRSLQAAEYHLEALRAELRRRE
jgi:hypothetical protein